MTYSAFFEPHNNANALARITPKIVKVMALNFRIRQLIKEGGYVSCDQLMREVLSLNPSSYYQHKDILGIEGDFITAPEISQLFGEIIGLWCIKEWQKIGCPSRINLIELGPGRGLLMRDLLHTAKLVPEFYQALTIELIEINPNFIAYQQTNLQGINLPINHHLFIKDIPQKPSIIIANEFFDAIPIKQYIKIKGLWYERVFIIDSGNQIKFDKIAVNKNLQDHLLQTHLEANDGAIIEESHESIKIMQFISNHLKNLSGSCLVIDYGYDINPSRRTRYQYNATIQAIKNHKYCPLLESLGAADLSVHVDFYALKAVAKNTGLNISETMSQRDFLTQNGILLRSKILQDKIAPAQAAIIKRQVDRLISPSQMGTLFKVLQVSNRLLA